MNNYKLNIGLIFGGMSEEHDVSIQSAININNALQSGINKDLYNIKLIYIDKKGNWFSSKQSDQILSYIETLQDKKLNIKSHFNLDIFPQLIKEVDLFYPALHGPNGEDGSIQGLFQICGIPCIGSGVLGSAVGMDKIIMKAIFSCADLPQVPFIALNKIEINEERTLNSRIKIIEEKIGYPCFIKPANLGSSLGITKASNKNQLIEGINFASGFDQRIVIEKGIEARELECAILGKNKLETSCVGEIKYNADWYDYKSKYISKSSHSIIPAEIPKDITQKVQELSIKACKALNVYGIARCDFFYDDKKNKLWINEINTLPGFTQQSMYPMLWNASGINMEKLVSKLVHSATK